MYNKNNAGDKENLSKSTSDDKYLPIDPGNQSEIGQKVETPIVKVQSGKMCRKEVFRMYLYCRQKLSDI